MIQPTTEDIEPLRVPIDKSIPNSFKEANSNTRKEKWRIAMEKELKALKDNNTWELVSLPKGGNALLNKWVFSYVVGPKVAEELEKQWSEKLAEEGKVMMDEI